MKKAVILLIALMLISLGFLSGCTETDKNGTDESEIIDDGINNSPKIHNVYASSTDVEVGESISFDCDAIDYDGEIVSYYWDFNDDTYSTKKNPSHTFKESGSFFVTVKVIDNDNDSGSDFISIRVNEIVPEPEIIDHNSYSSGDYVYVVGLIENVGSENIEFVNLTVTLYDSANNIIASDWTYASPTLIEVGKRACFKNIFSDIPYFDHYSIDIETFENYGTQPYPYLVTSGVSGSIGTLGYEVNGYIKNTGSKIVDHVTVNAVLYDDYGKILDKDSRMFFDLYSGQTELFELICYDWNIEPSLIADYEIMIGYWFMP